MIFYKHTEQNGAAKQTSRIRSNSSQPQWDFWSIFITSDQQQTQIEKMYLPEIKEKLLNTVLG